MKVLILPYGGDANPYIRLLANSLQAAGAKVSLVSGRRILFLPRVLRDVGRPDIIHLQWQHSYLTGHRWPKWPKAVAKTCLFFPQWTLLRILGVRSVWTVHNILKHERIQARWELLACRLLARMVDALIVHCDSVRATVASAYRISPERITVVPIGNYIGWYPTPPQKEDARRTLGIGANTTVFLSFGAMRAYKGFCRLLDAFRAVRARNARLLLAGRGEAALVRSLAEKASHDSRVITRFEFIEEELLMTYLGACDYVVLPYVDILASSAAVLAASCGRALIMPRIGCLQEFPPEAAILYDAQSPGALQAALERALRLPGDNIGAKAREYIEQAPWAMVGARTMELYRSVLE